MQYMKKILIKCLPWLQLSLSGCKWRDYWSLPFSLTPPRPLARILPDTDCIATTLFYQKGHKGAKQSKHAAATVKMWAMSLFIFSTLTLHVISSFFLLLFFVNSGLHLHFCLKLFSPSSSFPALSPLSNTWPLSGSVFRLCLLVPTPCPLVLRRCPLTSSRCLFALTFRTQLSHLIKLRRVSPKWRIKKSAKTLFY